MTEKHFTIDVEIENYENAYFEDDKFLCYEDDYDAILNRLNELSEENKELKEKIKCVKLLANHRGEMVSFANALIQDLDDEKIQDMWENFKGEMYKVWKQKRGIE